MKKKFAIVSLDDLLWETSEQKAVESISTFEPPALDDEHIFYVVQIIKKVIQRVSPSITTEAIK